jgi:hypothetical protein
MTLNIEATFENGVFVPANKPAIAEHQRVRLLVEPISPGTEARPPKVQLHDRIRVDPSLAEEIALSAEFIPEES